MLNKTLLKFVTSFGLAYGLVFIIVGEK